MAQSPGKTAPLSAAAIALPDAEVRIVARCGSTNTELLSLAEVPARPVLLAAEAQTAGRGRRGRRWHARPGESITFSLACRVLRPARELAALSLVAGAAVARSLRDAGVAAALKWPNDLLAGGAKLGGILVETRRQGGATLAVIGVGLNYRGDPSLARRLRRRVASLEELLQPLPDRNRLIRRAAEALLRSVAAFERGGLDAVRGEWQALDAHAGQRLRVRLADGRTVSGVAAGLADDGGLQLRTRGGLRAIRNGRIILAREVAA